MDKEDKTEQEENQKSKSVFSRRIVIGLVASFLLLSGITGLTITCFVLEQKVLKFRHHYGVIFDAGSTHTDITVYRWPSDVKDHGTAHAEQLKFETCSESGISSFEKSPSEAGKVIRKCIETIALKSLPHKDVKKTGIYVGATAGMRLLCERSQAACDQIMDSIKQALNAYKFRQTKNRVRVLTGEEEATFGWITANLLKNALANDLTPENNSRLIGSLDMGGASAEVAFIPDNLTIPENYTSEFTLYGQNYTLYTHSYLCFGFKETQRKLMASLVQASNYSKKVINPCWHKGYNETISASWVWLQPCVTKQPPVPITNRTVYKFIGSGAIETCETRIRDLFNQTNCESPNCTFDGVFQPPVKGKHFMAHSGFGRIGSFLNVSKGDSIITLKNHGEKFCKKDWQKVSSEYSDKFPNKKTLRSLCFNALYSYEMLTYGLNFEPESNDVQFTQNINGTEVGWSLGFMVNATNAIPVEAPTYRLTQQEFVTLLVICSVVALIGLAMLAICLIKRKLDRNMKYKYTVINN